MDTSKPPIYWRFGIRAGEEIIPRLDVLVNILEEVMNKFAKIAPIALSDRPQHERALDAQVVLGDIAKKVVNIDWLLRTDAYTTDEQVAKLNQEVKELRNEWQRLLMTAAQAIEHLDYINEDDNDGQTEIHD